MLNVPLSPFLFLVAAVASGAALAALPASSVPPRAAVPIEARASSVRLATTSRAVQVATRVHASHILVQSEELAGLCVQKLTESGAVFEELAETVSMCDSKARGGDLGWIFPGSMVAEFEKVVFSLPPEVLATVETTFGWHVVRVCEQSYMEPEIQPLELRARLQGAGADGSAVDVPRLQVVDLRSDEELSQAKIPSSLIWHLPYDQWQEWAPPALEGTLEPPLAKDVELIFMDHRGGRGERLMQYFAQNGFPLSRFLRGGINAYAEEADPRIPTYLESDGDCLTCHEH